MIKYLNFILLNRYTHFVYIAILFNFSYIYSQSIQDMQKLKKEYEKYQKQQNVNQLPVSSADEIDPTTGLPKKVYITRPKINNEIIDIDYKMMELKHFGYDFFTRRDSISFWENLPPPANYILGPGDELIISLWGGTQLRQSYTIARDGKIYDEKIGILNLMGKTIEQSEIYLINQFSRVYSTLKGNNPSTFMDISLGQLRSINVNFVGELKFPGVYPVHPFSTLITGLIQAGGVDTTGSLRNIQIKRNGKVELSLDLYDYLLKGDLPSNIQLRDQDIVFVPVRESKVIVDSSVTRPGIYESKPNENVKQMIKYAGGLSSDASYSISLKQRIPLERRDSSKVNSKNYYINYNNSELMSVNNGDIISVRRQHDVVDQVELIGQVKKPGIYNYFNGMILKDLLDLGSGFNDSTFLKSVYLNRGELIRRNPNSRYEKVIEVNIQNVINGGEEGKVSLQNLDRFVVHANVNFFEKKNLEISGEVEIPGSYPLLRDNETLQSLLERAGGFTSKAKQDGISIFREKKYFEYDYDSEIENEFSNNLTNQDRLDQDRQSSEQNIERIGPKLKKGILINTSKDKNKVRVAWENTSVPLMPGDSIVVKESTGTINVAGEVYNPGVIEFRKGKPLRYYVNTAGGITNNGNKKSIIVVYANGAVSPKKWYSSPRIDDGSTIIVNQKEFSEPLNITEFASNWTSIISSLITAFILTKQL